MCNYILDKCLFEILKNNLLNCSSYISLLKYYRYMESGCYRGFLKQVGQELIASELTVKTHKILLWEVYTDADFKLRYAQDLARDFHLKTLYVEKYSKFLNCNFIL